MKILRLPLGIACTVIIGLSAPADVCADPITKMIDSAVFVTDDINVIQQRLRDSFVPAPDAKMTGESADALLKTLRADGSWADQVYTDTNRENWRAGTHLGRVLRIAHEYYQKGSPLFGRADAKRAILAGLSYWLRVDPHNDNWWYNEIGVPLQVGELLVLLGNDATPETRQQGMRLMTRAQMSKMTGQNLVWTAQIQIIRGCISNAPELVEAAYARMWQEVRYAGPKEEGIQVDHSFHQHGPLIYAGGYGAGFTGDVARFEGYARGTRYALPADKKAIFEAYVLDGQQWMLHGGQWDYGVTGRELIRPGKNAASMVRPVTALAGEPGPRQNEMLAFAARLKNAPDAPILTGNRYYWLSDYMSHMRPGYFAATHMFSTRNANTDGLTNGENKTSHHIADGAMYLSRDGQEYAGIFPVWDWHLIPGTTVEQNTPLVPNKVRRMGTTTFVGGVSDGTYGLAAMDLVTGDLHAQKAWFYFDKEIVCLGAGITCPTSNLVSTSVNQCLLRGPVLSSIDPTKQLAQGPHSLEKAKGAAWVWHDEIGYVFPQPGAVLFHNQPQTGSFSLLGPGPTTPIARDVFSLWINHGAQASNSTYSYAVMPAAGVSETIEAAQNPSFTVLANTPEMQAVWHRGLWMLAVVFRKPSKIIKTEMTISVDHPCLLMARREGGKLHLAVSNPENTPLTVNVVVRAGMSPEKMVRIDLPGGLNAGQSVVQEIMLN